MFAAPAELLLAEPASAETRRLLSHIGEQLGAAPRLETAPASTYSREGSALAALEAFYGAEEEGSSAAGGSSGSASALAAVRALPPLVLCALAHLRDYLRPFGLESVLQLGGTFQEWTTAQEMRLSANTLRCGVGEEWQWAAALCVVSAACQPYPQLHRCSPPVCPLVCGPLQPARSVCKQRRRYCQGLAASCAGPHSGRWRGRRRAGAPPGISTFSLDERSRAHRGCLSRLCCLPARPRRPALAAACCGRGSASRCATARPSSSA